MVGGPTVVCPDGSDGIVGLSGDVAVEVVSSVVAEVVSSTVA